MNEKTTKKLLEWWDSLQNDNGGKAQLKRCHSPQEAILYPQTFKLKHILYWLPLEALATVAGVGAHIKSATGKNFGVALATPAEIGGLAPFSETRFRQLLSARDWQELYRFLRRAVTILDGKVSFVNFVETVILWSEEFTGKYKEIGKSLKFKLSEAYYTNLLLQEKK